jgi:hypothetical protein
MQNYIKQGNDFYQQKKMEEAVLAYSKAICVLNLPSYLGQNNNNTTSNSNSNNNNNSNKESRNNYLGYFNRSNAHYALGSLLVFRFLLVLCSLFPSSFSSSLLTPAFFPSCSFVHRQVMFVMRSTT